MDRLKKPKDFLEKLRLTDSDYQDSGMINHIADLLERYSNEQLILHGVSFSLPTDPMKLAEYLHNSYELIAKKTNWNTQESCKVKFKDLPSENKTTMILLAGKLILDFVGNET
jgi:hypothetical protein